MLNMTSRRIEILRALRWLALLGISMLGSLPREAKAARDVEPRLALVIGNANYRDGRLPTGSNDAGLVAQCLAQVGFDVTAMGDVDAATLRKTVHVFAEKLREAGARATVFVYLSGDGVQYAGENFVVPVDARIARQIDVPALAVPLAEIQGAIEGLPARARIFVYDLARETSIARADALPLAVGLTLLKAPRGSLYAFNAAPGTVTRPDLPPYGLFARALAEVLRTPGLTVQAAFTRVRLRVAEITGGADVPWDDSGLDPGLTLLARDADVAAEAGSLVKRPPEDTAFWTAIAADRFETYEDFIRSHPAEVLAARFKIIAGIRLEAATWSESVRVDTPPAYWTYMQRYPHGPHYVDVRRRLYALHASLEPPSHFDLFDFADLPVPSPDQVRGVDRSTPVSDDLEGAPMPRPADALLPQAPAATTFELAPPPLAPEGVLPFPAPLPAVVSNAWPETPGRIDQPFVRGLGLVSILTASQDNGGAMTLATEAGQMTSTTVVADKAQRTILQTNAANEVMSQTSVARVDGTLITITQTGPGGDPLSSIVTHVDPLGEHVTTIADGEGALVAKITADRRGVVKEVTRGATSLADTSYALPALEAAPSAAQPDAHPASAAPAVLTPDGPPAMPAFDSPDVQSAADTAPKIDPSSKSASSPIAGKILVAPTKSALPAVSPTAPRQPAGGLPAEPAADVPDTVPLPVSRPPQATMTPRRSAAPHRTRH